MDSYLSSVYYNTKRSGGYGGVNRLYDDVKKEGKFKISRKQIKEWLMKQDTYTLHKPVRRNFKRNRVIVGGIDQQWQMDLANMQSMQKFNDGYRYLLVCIDVFSKYAWVVPLKNKTGPSLVNAFKVILSSGRKPEKIMTDQGTEFLNHHFRALMQKEDIELYNTYNETKASIVERLIRTLKTKWDGAVEIHYEDDKNFVEPNAKTNVVIAAFTTAYARLKLYDVLDLLQERVLYYDTDSVIFLSKPAEPEPSTWNYLGNLTKELDHGDYIITFISGG